MGTNRFINAATEGDLDGLVLERVVAYVGGQLTRVDSGHGKPRLDRNIRAWNNDARERPWVVLRDLDHDAECVPALLQKLIPHCSQYMCFRVAVREVEAWLLADRERVAQFLRVDVHRVPIRPEDLDEPKQAMIALARRSPSRDIREDMVPSLKSRRREGPYYSLRLGGFVVDPASGWRLEIARQNSRSLDHCVEALARLVHAARREVEPW